MIAETLKAFGLLFMLLLCVLGSLPAEARDYSQRREFHRQNPCPSTGRTSGACGGYQVDHRVPLAAGGADRPSNMQWLTIPEHRAKTSYERQTCAYGCGVRR